MLYVKHNFIAALVVTQHSYANNLEMNIKTTKKPKKPLEPWQIEDALRLRKLFKDAQENLRLANKKPFTQFSFAEDFGLASDRMVWQYLNANRALNVKAAASFASGLGVPVESFSPTLAVQVGKVASAVRVPQLRAVESPAGRRLQWLSDDEAELLSEYRACAAAQKPTALGLVRALPKALSDDGAGDEDQIGGEAPGELLR